MKETFDLPVQFKGELLMFSSRLLQQGYTHKFVVEVDGQPVYFEPDEERNYRAIIETADVNLHRALNLELLKAVANALESIIK